MLNKEILNFFKNYRDDENSVNRLIISTFLLEKKISDIKNKKINNLVIQKDELEYSKLIEFRDIIKKENKLFCFEELLELFEFVISPSDKLVNGAIYTPKNIRKYITEQSFEKLTKKSLNNINIADIACGCGGFLIDASREMKQRTNKSYKKIFQENIYGVDIQKYSVERTEILLSLLAISENEDEKEFKFNIYVGDTLEYDWIETKFDIILGNPPYVCSRNMDLRTKELMKNWSTSKSGHPDLYIPFFQIGFELLKPKGVLGFITVNTFIHSVNGRAIREYFEIKKAKLQIIDFGDEQIFKSRLTYTCLCFIENAVGRKILYTMTKQNDLKPLNQISFTQENYTNLNAYNGWSLKDNSFIQEIESRGKKFGDIFDTKSGIATLKNSIYIFKPINKPNRKYYYIDENTPIEKSICKDIINSNRLAKDDLKDLIEKIIFPYKHDKNNQPTLIDEVTFQEKYPQAYQYLSAKKEILSTRDKGNGKYPAWYAFGRSQSLEKRKHKLFFPQLVKEGFITCYSENSNLYFYNGMCAYASKEELIELQQIMSSVTFWKYVENKAKHYASGYYGLGRNYLKDFGVNIKGAKK